MDIQFKREFREAIESGRKVVTRRRVRVTVTRRGWAYDLHGVERDPEAERWVAYYLSSYYEDDGSYVVETTSVPCRYDRSELRPRYGPRFRPEYGPPLRVVSVRPERLGDITDADARREAIGALGYAETRAGFLALWAAMYPQHADPATLVWRIELRADAEGER